METHPWLDAGGVASQWLFVWGGFFIVGACEPKDIRNQSDGFLASWLFSRPTIFPIYIPLLAVKGY